MYNNNSSNKKEYSMQHTYIVLDDTGHMYKHGHQFETVASAFAYINAHKLGATHLVYNLCNATVVHTV